MLSSKKNCWEILPFLIYYFGLNSDAFTPNCDHLSDKCQCHSTYATFYTDTKMSSKICLKMFKRKMSWSDADKVCRRESSYLVTDNFLNSVPASLGKNASTLGEPVWTGIKRTPNGTFRGYYLKTSNYPELFMEDPDGDSFDEWAKGEPVYDCAAWIIESLHLITLPCDTKLEFVCQNTGFPVYPVSGTLACPQSWLFYYHSPTTSKKCIRPFSFHPGTFMDTSEACSNIGGTVADIGVYVTSYNYLSRLNITGFRVPSNGGCIPAYLEAVVGGSVGSTNCSHVVFICERDRRNSTLTVRLLPEISYSLSNVKDGFLTCDVSFRDQNVSNLGDQLQYFWLRDGMPLKNNHSQFWFRDVPDSALGHYRCGVIGEGLEEAYMSSEATYFYLDVSTYVITLEGDATRMRYRDFSQKDYQKFTRGLSNFMTMKYRSFRELHPLNSSESTGWTWNFQNAWHNGNNVSLKAHLYIGKSDILSTSQMEEEFYQILKNHFMKKEENDTQSIVASQLLSADTCYEETVPISETSYHDLLLWKETKTEAISKPMCLNDWILITRECKPNLLEGATWLPFNYSLCTKYLSAVKNSKIQCPDSFKPLEENLCYMTYKDKLTYEEAEEVCYKRSSYLMDLEAINKTLLSKLELSSTYWISERRPSEWFEEYHSILHDDRQNPRCIVVKKNSETRSYSISSCDDSKNFSLVCIHQPLTLLETIAFSRSWKKFTHQDSCYFVDDTGKTWEEANKFCQAFPVKSSLLQSIRNLNDYSIFKVLLPALTPLLKGFSWWTDLLQENNSLKWSSFPEESVTFVDWEENTDFSMERTGVVLVPDPSNESSILWSLKDLSSKAASICEIQSLEYTHSTSVYIDVGGEGHNQDDANYYNVNLHCVPSGWFVSKSVAWFKDGDPVEHGMGKKHLSLVLKAPFELEEISKFQGYYQCSVDEEIRYEQIFSSKVLVRAPGVHTFVLFMKSDLSKLTSCYDALPLILSFNEELRLHLREIFLNESMTVLKNVECIDHELHIYDHVYISEDFGNEKKIQKIFENSMNARNDILLELLNKFHVDKKDISFRSTVSCPREKSNYNGWELNWPDTSIGESTVPEEICVTDNGDPLERNCLGDFDVGGFWSPVRNACATVSSSVTTALHELSKKNITEDNILNSVANVDSLISTSDSLSSTDVTYLAQILRNVATVPVIKPKVLKSVVHTVDTIINTMSVSDNRDSLSNVPNKISSAVETIVSNTETNDQVIEIARDNIAISVVPNNANASSILTGGVLESWGSNVTTLFNDSSIDRAERLDQFEMFEAAVLLPDNLLSRNQSINATNIAITIHKNYYYIEDSEVISAVVDVTLGNAPVYNVDPPVEMVFKVPEHWLTENNFSWGCVYWDKTMNDKSGGWSYEGCYTHLLDSEHVQCYCDHLTSFAVILEIKYHDVLTPVHRNLLSIITYIGCFLSIFGLGSIILTFIVFSKWRLDVKHKVLFNLSLSLCLFLIVFVCGIERVGSVYGCMVVALLLHYFMLASFAWMLVEAVLQYCGLVKVIGTYIPRFTQKASLFAWGLPLIIVVAVLSVDHNLYSGRREYCWVSEKAFLYAVAAPVLLMLAVNFVIFGIISYSITCGRSKKYLRSNQSDKQEMITRTKAVFCVSVLLGMSWVFGFLAAMEGVELIFQYLFTITTTLQGFLFFIFFVLRQKKTRELWLTFLKGPKPHISRNTGGTETDSGESRHEPFHNKLHRVSYKAKMQYVTFNR